MSDRMTVERFKRGFHDWAHDARPPARAICYMGAHDLRELIADDAATLETDPFAAGDAPRKRWYCLDVPIVRVNANRWMGFAQDPRPVPINWSTSPVPLAFDGDLNFRMKDGSQIRAVWWKNWEDPDMPARERWCYRVVDRNDGRCLDPIDKADVTGWSIAI